MIDNNFEAYRCEDCVYGIYDDELDIYFCTKSCDSEIECELNYEDDERT